MGQRQYVMRTDREQEPAHLRLDSKPMTLCGTSMTGERWTTHPVVTGGALDCTACARLDEAGGGNG